MLYGNNTSFDDVELENPNELFEQELYSVVSRMSDSDRKAFCESAEAEALVEAGIFRRNTLVRLSKMDDLERRTGMASIQLAKEKNDSLYTKLIKNREKERELLSAIDAKYGTKAQRVAVKGQREWQKNAVKIPAIVKKYTTLPSK